jgi:hypothetical protein
MLHEMLPSKNAALESIGPIELRVKEMIDNAKNLSQTFGKSKIFT